MFLNLKLFNPIIHLPEGFLTCIVLIQKKIFTSLKNYKDYSINQTSGKYNLYQFSFQKIDGSFQEFSLFRRSCFSKADHLESPLVMSPKQNGGNIIVHLASPEWPSGLIMQSGI